METAASVQSAQADSPKHDDASEKALIKKWHERVTKAKAHWKDDFERMRSNMKFAAGLQWNEQAEIDTDQYVANITLKAVNQKVSSLYARNPKAVYQRRKRMDYSLWDGKLETLQQMFMRVQANPMDMEAISVLLDHEQGKTWQELVDKIGQTMETTYEWQIDQQSPSFKEQMKQLVRRVVITGVGYVRLSFARSYEQGLSSTETDSTVADRAKRAKHILERLEKGEIQESSPEMETFRQLASSIGSSIDDGDTGNVNERLVFDFPLSTSIIPDTNVRNLKDFVGARWIAQEFILPIQEVKEFFEVTDLKDYKQYNDSGALREGGESASDSRGCVWCIYDRATKTQFYLLDGYDQYLSPPESVKPNVSAFFPIFALTFNDIETEPNRKIPVYPPSDVQLMKSAQKEWNRSREALRAHRRYAGPKHMTRKGWLSTNDKAKLENPTTGAVIELEGAAPDSDINKLLAPFAHAPIDPAVYNTGPQAEDIMYTLGAQESNLGPVSKGTATGATIAEQSRMTITSSNVDDLDDLLSKLARAGGETMLREMSPETIQRIAGRGAAWPDPHQREDFVNEIYMEIQAASSGRPNKALEIANFERLGPLLLQAGANPQFIVRESIKRLDDRIDPEDAFPLIPPMAGNTLPKPAGGEPQAGQPQNGGRPTMPMPNGN